MQQEYPPAAIVRVLTASYLPRRGLTLVSRAAGSPPVEPPSGDDIVSAMQRMQYLRLDARRAAPRGARDRAVFVVLAAGGKHAQHAPDLRALFASIEAEPGLDRLDEVTVIAEEDFFAKKHMLDVIL